jgi:hypothetical protein
MILETDLPRAGGVCKAWNWCLGVGGASFIWLMIAEYVMQFLKRIEGVVSMKMQEIRIMAKKLGVNSFGKTKTELIREIQRKEGYFDCFKTAVDGCDQLECLFRSPCLEKPSSK